MARKHEGTMAGQVKEKAAPLVVTAPSNEEMDAKREAVRQAAGVFSKVVDGIDLQALAEELDGPETVITAEQHAKRFIFRPGKDHLVGWVMLPKINENGFLLWKKHSLGHGFERVYIDTRTKAGEALIRSKRWQWKLTTESAPVDLKGIRLKEDFTPVDPKVKEDWFGSEPLDINGGSNPNSEYLSLLGGPQAKQLYLYDHLDAHAKCFETKNHNPLAKQAVDVISNYSLGKGVNVQFKNAQIQEKFDRFASRTRFHWRMRQDCDQLTWEGNAINQYDKDEKGRIVPTQIDPSTIWEIVTNPRNINEIWYYHQQYPTQWQMLFSAKDAGLADNPESLIYVINEIPADKVIHTKINCTSGEKWGRSDLFPILGWLKFFKDFYCAAVVQAQAQASYYLKRKVKGNTTDVTQFASDPMVTTTPRPGTAIVENESVDTTLMSGTSGSVRSNDNAGEAIRSICATGVGLAPEHLGVGGAASVRATALTKAQPAARKFENRQWVMELHTRQEVDYWLVNDAEARMVVNQVSKLGLAPILKALKEGNLRTAMALIATMLTGALQYNEPVDRSYEVFFPDINTEDRSNTIKDLYTAFSFGTYCHEAASRKVAKLLGDTTYDYQDEQERRRQEEQDKDLKPIFGLQPPWGGRSGAPAGDGAEPDAKPGSAASDADYQDNAQDPGKA